MIASGDVFVLLAAVAAALLGAKACWAGYRRSELGIALGSDASAWPVFLRDQGVLASQAVALGVAVWAAFRYLVAGRLGVFDAPIGSDGFLLVGLSGFAGMCAIVSFIGGVHLAIYRENRGRTV